MTTNLSTRNVTEFEGEFLKELREPMDNYQVEIQYDPMDVPVFCDENGVGIFLSIHDVHDYLPKNINE